MTSNIPVTAVVPETPQALVELIQECRRSISDSDNGASEKAISAFEVFARESGKVLVSCAELPDMITPLMFLENVERINNVLSALAKSQGEQLAKNPITGIVIEQLCKLNQEVEALQLLAQLTKNFPNEIKNNPSIFRGLEALHRKGADIKVSSISDWINSAQNPDQFPTFPRLDAILAERLSTGQTSTTIQR